HQQFVDDRRCRGNQVEIVFALKTLLDDLHVQHAEEADTETETERVGGLRLIEQRRVIERQLAERITKIFIVIGTDREHAGIHLRLDLLETRQRRHLRCFRQRQGVAHRRTMNVLDTRVKPTHFTRFKRLALGALRGKYANAINDVRLPGGLDQELVALLQAPFHDAYQRYHAEIIVEPGINDQRLRLAFTITFRRRNAFHQLLKQVFNADTGLGAD